MNLEKLADDAAANAMAKCGIYYGVAVDYDPAKKRAAKVILAAMWEAALLYVEEFKEGLKVSRAARKELEGDRIAELERELKAAQEDSGHLDWIFQESYMRHRLQQYFGLKPGDSIREGIRAIRAEGASHE